MKMTEDQVRDLLRQQTNINVGQQTTFKNLGFENSDINELDSYVKMEFNIKNALNNKPDGWFIDNENDFMIVAETKNSKEKIDDNVEQLFKYIHIAKTKYNKVIGIIFNGNETRVFRNFDPIETKNLEDKSFYLDLFKDKPINKNLIYKNSKRINDLLHFNFGLKHLNERMIFTACILVARGFNTLFNYNDSLSVIKTKTKEVLEKNISDDSNNEKVRILLKIFKGITFTKKPVKSDIVKLIDSINTIALDINSNKWEGEDVMAIFFNEFSRYKGKSENGQVFTPDHITSLMVKIADINIDDNVLDAACGSGSFLTKAMAEMISKTNGSNSNEAAEIKSKRIFGIENDQEIFALASANMLIHKDGKSNIILADALTEKAAAWIKSNKITKVLMNPPYENALNPIGILRNVIDNVEKNADVLFLMPNSKLQKYNRSKKVVNEILSKHTLKTIIKLPDVFAGLASTGDVSIFHFVAHVPQNDKKIIGFHIPDDGLETIKNQGRHDIHNIWNNDLEEYWVNSIINSEDPRYNSKIIIDKNQPLEYPDDFKESVIYRESFERVAIDRVIFESPDIETLLNPRTKTNPNGMSPSDWIMLSLKLMGEKDIRNGIKKIIEISNKKNPIDNSSWKDFAFWDVFEKVPGRDWKAKSQNKYKSGEVALIGAKNKNNGVARYVKPNNEITIINFIGLNLRGNGGAGLSHYHDYESIITSTVMPLKLKDFELNRKRAEFLISILNNNLFLKYRFEKGINNEVLNNEKICLPSDEDGNIDWNYIEEFEMN